MFKYPRISYLRTTSIMADAQAYEQRASEAEKIVQELEQQVKQVRAAVEAERLKAVEAANRDLEQQVMQAKKELRQAQLKNKTLQVAIPNDPVSDEFAEAYKTTYGSPNLKKPESAPQQSKSSAEKPAAAAEAKPKKEKKKKQKAPKQTKPAEPDVPGISRVNFLVGLITEAKMHPDADSLYVETIDVGEDEPRTVISGLAKHVPLEQMQNRLIVLCANLKPRKMRGILSQGMVMCASGDGKVEPIAPPADSKPGDAITFEGFERVPDAVLPPKKKIYEGVAPELKTNDQGVATYKGIPFVVAGKGECKAEGMANVPVQ